PALNRQFHVLEVWEPPDVVAPSSVHRTAGRPVRPRHATGQANDDVFEPTLRYRTTHRWLPDLRRLAGSISRRPRRTDGVRPCFAGPCGRGPVTYIYARLTC